MNRNVMLGVAIAIMVGLVIGGLVASRDGGMSCDEWQRRYAAAQQNAGSGVLGSINQGPAAEELRELEEQRPEGCAAP